MKVEEVVDMWEQDSAIDDNHLDTSSITTPKLHAKYLKLLIDSKIRKAKCTADYNQLRQLKFRYYRGEMTRDELKELGWEQWQYNKPLKAEMDEFLKGDADLIKLDARIEYMETMIYTLESILTQIKARDWQIRNAISYKQFLAGS